MINVTAWEWFAFIRPVMEIHHGPLRLFGRQPLYYLEGCPDGLYDYRGSRGSGHARSVLIAFRGFLWEAFPGK